MAKRPPKPENRTAQPRHKDKTKSLAECIEAARHLTEPPETLSKISVEKFMKLDDRSFAIMRAANVENALETIILDRLHNEDKKSLLRSDGPLGTFSRKIAMGYAMRIFGPITKENLNIIRNVRNIFAHAKTHIDFQTEELFELCSFIKIPAGSALEDSKHAKNREIIEEKAIISRAVYAVASIEIELRLYKIRDIKLQNISSFHASLP